LADALGGSPVYSGGGGGSARSIGGEGASSDTVLEAGIATGVVVRRRSDRCREDPKEDDMDSSPDDSAARLSGVGGSLL
jgi:hypothetical protein